MELMLTTAVALVLTTGEPITDPALIAALEDSRAYCAAEGGTELRYRPDLVSMADILGDGTADDRIVSEVSAFCGPDIGPLYAGSAGGPLQAIIGERVFPLLPGGWSIVEAPFTFEGATGQPVRMLLVGSHGSYCDTTGAVPCVTAYTWDGERLVSVLNMLDP
jgi:hypothetical protein